MSDPLESQLQEYYTRAFPARQGVQVSNLARLTPGGMEHEMYFFDVAYGAAGERQHERLVLRLYSGDDAYTTSASSRGGRRGGIRFRVSDHRSYMETFTP